MTGFDGLRRRTPARLDVGRAGARPRTAALLRFRRDHAAARDAVWSQWPPGFIAHLEDLGFLVVASAATSREGYVLNPPLGRRLAPGEAERIRAANEPGQSGARSSSASPLIQLVLSDGLSALAAERHCDAIVPRLREALGQLGRLAVPVATRNGRVALGDQVAIASAANLVVHLIGERPGLATPESLGCYLTLAPCATTTDAERKCVSNIHAKGLNPVEAAATIAGVAQRILQAGTSGMSLAL